MFDSGGAGGRVQRVIMLFPCTEEEEDEDEDEEEIGRYRDRETD